MIRSKLPPWLNKYTLSDAVAAGVTIVVPFIFLLWLPKYVHPMARFGIGIPFALGVLLVYFLLRKPDEIIESELRLSRAIAKLEVVVNDSEKESMRRVEKELQDIFTLLATIAATIFHEGVAAYHHEIQNLSDIVDAACTMVNENQLDKHELKETIDALEEIARQVDVASVERVARAKAKLDFVQELHSKSADAQDAVQMLRGILERLDKDK